MEPVPAKKLLAAVKNKNEDEAERLFAALMNRDGREAFDTLLYTVQENIEVHRTVLPYRAWEMRDLVGAENAEVLLRQSVHYCLEAERERRPEWEAHGAILTSLLDEHRLLGRDPGTRVADDHFVERLSLARHPFGLPMASPHRSRTGDGE